MSAQGKSYQDIVFLDSDLGGRIDEVAEYLCGITALKSAKGLSEVIVESISDHG